MGSEARLAALNGSQLLAVAAALRVAERAVDDIARALSAPASGITFRFADDVKADERRAIEAACGRLRVALAKACRRLGIEAVERSRRGMVRGEISTVWAMLEDSKSRALRGYGPLSGDAAAAVDAEPDQITQELVGILGLVA